MYTLYYAPGAASFAVHWMLIEIGEPFELKLVNFAREEQRSPAYLKLNPLGKVPTLIVDGQPCTEATALLMLLAERHPSAELAPLPGHPDRGSYLELMTYLANTLLPAFRAWFYPGDFGPDDRADEVRDNARSRIEAALGRLDDRLSDGRQYLLGPQFTAADMLATMLARWSRNMPKPADQWPFLHAYLMRMRSRDDLRTVHEREGLTDWIEWSEPA